MTTASNRIERDMGDKCRTIRLKSFADTRWIEIDHQQALKIMGVNAKDWCSLKAFGDCPRSIDGQPDKFSLEEISNWVARHP